MMRLPTPILFPRAETAKKLEWKPLSDSDDPVTPFAGAMSAKRNEYGA